MQGRQSSERHITMFSIVGLLALSVAAWDNGRIVGGYAVTPESKYPWIVSLALMGSHQCGGMAYSKDIVLTAAHCTIFDDEDWTVRFRHYNLEEKPRHEFKVAKRRRHPEYNHKKFDLNDIALWKIKGCFNLDTYVTIDKDSISYTEGWLLKVAGWGNLREAEHGNTKLMEVQIPTFNMQKCMNVLGAEKRIVDPKAMFCAGFPEGGKDACYGDSGGPIFTIKGNSPVVVGIVSWGVGCAKPGLPAVFTRLEAYSDFIKTSI